MNLQDLHEAVAGNGRKIQMLDEMIQITTKYGDVYETDRLIRQISEWVDDTESLLEQAARS
jgi:hypothetical protein